MATLAKSLDEAPGCETKRGTCPICGVGCYVTAKISNNRPVSIRPDRTAGFPADCPRAGQAVEYHDHPDRVNYPMKRTGKRGEGIWERISWDQALDEIAEKLAAIRDRRGPEAVQTMGGSYKGAGDSSCWRWSNLWGTPNILYQGKNCGEAELLSEWAVYGDQACIGNAAIPGVTKSLILWGVGGSMALASQRKNLKAFQAAGGKMIAIDPCQTEITDLADLWLQIRPGADGALAYGMLHVIITEKLFDAEFVSKWCNGFEALSEAVKPFTPERTSEITWIPADKIVEAARMFATNTPGHIPFGLGTAELGKATTSAVFGKTYLRAITGNLDVMGGSRFADPPSGTHFREEMHWDKLIGHPLRTRDNISADLWPIASIKGLKAYRAAMSKVHPLGVGPAIYNVVVAPSALPTAILESKPYPIKALILQAGNPLVSLTDARRLHEAMLSDELELSVNMDHWMTPCGELADYVLPATDGLERPLLSNMWGFGDAHSASRRTVDPRYERRDDYQLWRELGNRLGQRGMWPDTMEQWFDDILAPSGVTHGELADRDMPWVMAAPQYKRYENAGFATASGKVELSSDLLASLGYPPIPAYEEPAWSPERTPELFAEFPLIMSTGNSLKWYYRSQHKHLAQMRKQHPYALLTLHPDTAAGFGIAEGAMVWVETPMGKIQQMAKFDTGLHPRVVHADSHMWYPEREADGDAHYGLWESNINAILPDGAAYSDYAGDNYMRALICRVTPVAAD
ncbi:MAG: molybdopterin-dependent oxidoreductase [Novosphingobium sp.]